MKKIGIITLFGYNNYGNRLQMFAVQTVYKKMGFDSEIIRYQLPTPKEPLVIKFKVAVHYLLNLKSNISITYLKQRRICRFKSQAKKSYRESETYVNPLAIDNQFHQNYSFLSVGSDQIWGWFTHLISDFVFLKFAPREKRITFSPSFGSSTIEKKYRESFAIGIKGFKDISIREESGSVIVKDFTGKDSIVLCDPTMCLSKEEWLKFSSIHKKKPTKKYVLTYFLGEVPPKASRIVNNLSAEFEIVNLNSFNSPQYYEINPSEWVDYVNSASLFLTDSFHGVVFAIIMQTPFTVYQRVGGETMHTRITGVLEKFQMENRLGLSVSSSSLFELDFTNTQEIIHSEMNKVNNFLKTSLSDEIYLDMQFQNKIHD